MLPDMIDKARRIARGLRRWRRWTKASELQRLIDEATELLDEVAEQPHVEEPLNER